MKKRVFCFALAFVLLAAVVPVMKAQAIDTHMGLGSCEFNKGIATIPTSYYVGNNRGQYRCSL